MTIKTTIKKIYWMELAKTLLWYKYNYEEHATVCSIQVLSQFGPYTIQCDTSTDVLGNCIMQNFKPISYSRFNAVIPFKIENNPNLHLLIFSVEATKPPHFKVMIVIGERWGYKQKNEP